MSRAVVALTAAVPMLPLVDRDGRIASTAFVEITSVGQLEDLVRTHLGIDR